MFNKCTDFHFFKYLDSLNGLDIEAVALILSSQNTVQLWSSWTMHCWW